MGTRISQFSDSLGQVTPKAATVGIDIDEDKKRVAADVADETQASSGDLQEALRIAQSQQASEQAGQKAQQDPDSLTTGEKLGLVALSLAGGAALGDIFGVGADTGLAAGVTGAQVGVQELGRQEEIQRQQEAAQRKKELELAKINAPKPSDLALIKDANGRLVQVDKRKLLAEDPTAVKLVDLADLRGDEQTELSQQEIVDASFASVQDPLSPVQIPNAFIPSALPRTGDPIIDIDRQISDLRRRQQSNPNESKILEGRIDDLQKQQSRIVEDQRITERRRDDRRQELKRLRVPGLEFSNPDKVLPTEKQAGDLRKAKTLLSQLNQQTQEVVDLISDSSAFDRLIPSVKKSRLESGLNNLRLEAKAEALFNLGVLAGVDLELLKKSIPDATTIKSALKEGVFGKEQLLEKFRKFQDDMETKLKTNIEGFGFRLSPGQTFFKRNVIPSISSPVKFSPKIDQAIELFKAGKGTKQTRQRIKRILDKAVGPEGRRTLIGE